MLLSCYFACAALFFSTSVSHVRFERFVVGANWRVAASQMEMALLLGPLYFIGVFATLLLVLCGLEYSAWLRGSRLSIFERPLLAACVSILMGLIIGLVVAATTGYYPKVSL